MRPLKFRAWHTIQKKMYSAEEMSADQLTLMPDGRGFVNVSGKDTKLSTFAGNRMIPLQFTSLHDKHGKEIWEGDVVQYCYRPGAGMWNMNDRAVISWKSTGFHIEAIGGGFFGWLTSIPGASASDQPNKLFEILGNRYEHPDLLKQEVSR